MKQFFYTLLICCAAASSTQATTFAVTNTNDGGIGSFRQAILDANADPTSTPGAPHIINFESGGTVAIASTLPDIACHVVINGAANRNGTGETVIDPLVAGAIVNIMNILASIEVEINDVTFRNGNNAFAGGGAINNRAHLKLTRCIFDSNVSSSDGGAITNLGNDPSLTARECIFTNNTASGEGGAIGTQFLTTLTLLDCTFSRNSTGAHGGAIASYGTTFISGNTFESNTAGDGILAIMQGTTDVENTTFSKNFSNNVIDIHPTTTQALFVHCTIAQNGASNNGIAADARLDMYSTIVYGHMTDIQNGSNLMANVNNIVGFCTGCSPVFSSADPMLMPLANNGGPTQTMALRMGSPAIDVGASVASIVSDQRRVLRDALPDIGAYEFATSLPIGMTDFLARRTSVDKVLLTWATGSELNNRGFEIQRKLNSEEDFKTVGWVVGHGTTTSPQTYSYTDLNASEELSYYRIRQVDFSNHAQLSATQAVNGKATSTNVSVFPNPSTSQSFLRFDSEHQNKKATILVYAVDGRLIATQTIVIQATQLVAIPESENLPAGLYTVRIMLASGEAMVHHFEKINPK